jgi:hypothetical protein
MMNRLSAPNALNLALNEVYSFEPSLAVGSARLAGRHAGRELSRA